MATREGVIVSKGDATSEIQTLIEKYSGRLKDVLPHYMTPERMIRVASMLVNTNSKLRECSALSLVAGIVQAASHGLELGTEAYLVPFKGEAVMVPDYRGVLKRARNSGKVGNIILDVVRKGDRFSVQRGMHPDLIHEPLLTGKFDEAGKERDITHFYGVVWLHESQFPQFEVMTQKEMKEFRDTTPTAAYKKGPWWDEQTYPAMGMKTMAKRVLKLCPLSSDDLGLIQQDDRFDASGEMPDPRQILRIPPEDPTGLPAKPTLDGVATRVMEQAAKQPPAPKPENPAAEKKPEPKPKATAKPAPTESKPEPAPEPQPEPEKPKPATTDGTAEPALDPRVANLRDLIYEAAEGDEEIALNTLKRVSSIRPGGQLRFAESFEALSASKEDWWINKTTKAFEKLSKEIEGAT